MIAPLKLSSRAEHDLKEACAWYDHVRFGLGNDFLHSVEDVLARIQNNPEGYAVIHAPYRRALVRRFSFAVFFRLKENGIIVSAILHTSRSPALSKNRLSLN